MSLQSGLVKGYLIDGHRIEAELEQDILGTLYLATNLADDRLVALKVVNPILAQDPIFIQQFQLETGRLAPLHHPNILAIHDIRDTNQATYLSMEYVEGEPLSTILGLTQDPPWRLGVPFLQQAMEAIDSAHRAGILHESLKPERILITPQGQAKVKDFGLARMLKKVSLLPLTYNDADIRGYPAPEQLDAQGRVDERSDVYSLGLILYEILTGTLPFDRNAPDFVVRSTLNDALIQNPARLNPDVPRRLAQIAMKALRKNPNDRYASVRAMLDDLNEAEQSARNPHRAPKRTRFRVDPRQLLTPLHSAYALVALLLATAGVYAFRPPAASPFQVLSLEGPAPARAASQPERTPARPTVDRTAPTRTTPPDPPARPTPDPDPVPPPPILPPSASVSASPAATPLPPDPTPTAATPSLDPAPAPPPDPTTTPPSNPKPTRRPAVPAATVPPAPRVGWLAITSSPSGAVVLLDGRLTGKTPKRGMSLLPGIVHVVLTLEGYEAITTQVDVAAGETAAIDRVLAPKPGTVKLHIRPRGDIYLDDSLVVAHAEGLHTLLVSPDSHRVAVRHDTFGAWERSVLARYDTEHVFRIDFTQKAPLDITSFDRFGAFVLGEIWVDGFNTGQFTPMTVPLSIGRHVIEVRASGYRSVEPVIVSIDLDEPRVVEFVLDPEDPPQP
jgi:serine/threonine-protein kinase